MKRIELAVIRFKDRFRKGIALFSVGVLFNILETWGFGWHKTASCQMEFLLDIVSLTMMSIGVYYINTSKLTINVDLKELNDSKNIGEILMHNVNENGK